MNDQDQNLTITFTPAQVNAITWALEAAVENDVSPTGPWARGISHLERVAVWVELDRHILSQVREARRA